MASSENDPNSGCANSQAPESQESADSQPLQSASVGGAAVLPVERRGWAFIKDPVIQVLVILALTGFVLYMKFEPKVFPSASLDLKYSREEIARQAKQVAQQLGYKADKPIESTTFTIFNDSKTFLEYELGLDRAKQLMREKIPVWAWTTRFCREFQIEQCRVWLSPQGKLIAFSRAIEDERALPNVSHDQARDLAAKFILTQSGEDTANLKLVRDESTAKIKREDHSFTWEDQREEFKGARLRYFVSISGNEVTTYSKTLFIPDQWTRKYKEMRSHNEALQSVASIFYTSLQLVAFLVVPWALTRKQMRWRFAIFGGLLTGLVAGLDEINDFATVLDAYEPQSGLRDYLFSYYFKQSLALFGSFVNGVLLFGGADVVYRLCYPRKVALENYLNFGKTSGYATREGRWALMLGYCVFAIHLGWIIAYYMLGERLNFWCPLGVDDYQILGSAVPFFSAISLGIHAATQEETIARVVALSLAEKLTGRFWLANLFQAASWGFMHSNYAQQPAYARGVELTLAGLFYGFIFRRYGLLPCFIGHYLVDAFLDAKPLFSAADPWLRFSGLLPLVPFVLVWLLVRVKKTIGQGLTAADETLFNEALPVAPAVIHSDDDAEDVYVYKPFSRAMRIRLAIVAIIGLVFSFNTSTPQPGDKSRVTIDRNQAVGRAKEILKHNGLNPADFQCVASLATNLDSEELQYVFEQSKLDKTLKLANITQPGFLWGVRFFKFMDSTEYKVELTGDGREYSFDVTEDEQAAGAKISKAEAEKIALEYLHRVHPEYSDIVIDKTSWEDRKNRSDYDVVCKVPSLKVGDADYKVTLQVIGNSACNFSQAWMVPSQWTFERQKQTRKDTICKLVGQVFYGIIGVLALWWAVGILRSGAIRWRPAIILGLVCGALVMPEQLNHLPVILTNYDTAINRDTFIFNQVMGIGSSALSKFGSVFVLLAMALAVYRIISPRVGIASVLRTAFLPTGVGPRLTQQELWLDGILVALAWAAVSQTKDSLVDFALFFYSPEIRTASIYGLAALNDYVFPVGSDIVELVPSFLNSVAVALIFAGLYSKYCPRWSYFLLFILIQQAIKYSYLRHWQDYSISVISDTLQNIIYWYFVARLARYNPVAYLVKIVADDSLPFLYLVWIYGWPCFAPTFFSLLIYGLAPLLLFAYFRARNKRLALPDAAVSSGP
jgi:Type II CAAX prenyl endopeptidase Rce1-like